MDESKSPRSHSSSSNNSSCSRGSSKEPESPGSDAKSSSNSPTPAENPNFDSEAEVANDKKDLQQHVEDQENLSDVSDADDSIDFEDTQNKSKDIEGQVSQEQPVNDLRQKLHDRRNQKEDFTNGVDTEFGENKKENDEDALDFEAEEGECTDIKEKEHGEAEVIF